MLNVEELKLISEIAHRGSHFYSRYGRVKVSPGYIMAEINFVHTRIVPLRLRELRDADDSNFMHDVAGIHRHLNMPAGVLEDCFLPRFSARTTSGSVECPHCHWGFHPSVILQHIREKH